jgi:transposase
MRVIGMDVHRAFAQVAILDDGKVVSEQRIDLVQDKVVAFGRALRPDDEVVLEATGNTAAIERLLRPFVGRVVIANPRMVRAIAYARVKTDKIDAVTLARLQASGFLPEVWAADEDTVRRRRQASERMGLLDETVRLKSRIHAILHANLIPKYKGQLFGPAGRRWLAKATLPEDFMMPPSLIVWCVRPAPAAWQSAGLRVRSAMVALSSAGDPRGSRERDNQRWFAR